MKSKSIVSLLALLAVLVFVLPASGLAGKGHKVKTNVLLPAGEPLVIDVDETALVRSSTDWVCLIVLHSAGSSHKELKRIEVEADGSWVAYDEAPEKKKGEEGDDDDSASGDDDDSADWQSKSVLTLNERLDRKDEKALGDFTVETDRGNVKRFDPASAGEAPVVQLVLPASMLPNGSFDVGTNGFFGLSIGGHKIGSPGMSGVVRVKR